MRKTLKYLLISCAVLKGGYAADDGKNEALSSNPGSAPAPLQRVEITQGWLWNKQTHSYYRADEVSSLIATQNSELAGLRSVLAAQNAELNGLRTATGGLNSTIGTLNATVGHLNETVRETDGLRSDLANTRSQLAQSDAELRGSRDRIADLEARLTAAIKEKDAILTAKSKAEESETAQKQRFEQIEKETADQKQRLEILEKSQTELQLLAAEIKKKEEELREEKEKTIKNAEKIKALEEELERKKQEELRLRTACEKLQKENEESKDRAAAYSKAVAENDHYALAIKAIDDANEAAKNAYKTNNFKQSRTKIESGLVRRLIEIAAQSGKTLDQLHLHSQTPVARYLVEKSCPRDSEYRNITRFSTNDPYKENYLDLGNLIVELGFGGSSIGTSVINFSRGSIADRFAKEAVMMIAGP